MNGEGRSSGTPDAFSPSGSMIFIIKVAGELLMYGLGIMYNPWNGIRQFYFCRHNILSNMAHCIVLTIFTVSYSNIFNLTPFHQNILYISTFSCPLLEYSFDTVSPNREDFFFVVVTAMA